MKDEMEWKPLDDADHMFDEDVNSVDNMVITKELPFQTEEMSEIMDLRSCLRKIAHNQESLTAEKMSQMAREVLEK